MVIQYLIYCFSSCCIEGTLKHSQRDTSCLFSNYASSFSSVGTPPGVSDEMILLYIFIRPMRTIVLYFVWNRFFLFVSLLLSIFSLWYIHGPCPCVRFFFFFVSVFNSFAHFIRSLDTQITSVLKERENVDYLVESDFEILKFHCLLCVPSMGFLGYKCGVSIGFWSIGDKI